MAWSGLILSMLVGANAPSYIVLWLSLELNLMMFIGILMSGMVESAICKFKYFLIQSLGSSMVFMAVICNSDSSSFIALFSAGLGIKMAIAPFHLWLVDFLQTSSSTAGFMVLSIQKVLPVLLLANMLPDTISGMFIIASAIWGAAGGLVESGWKVLMGYSSVFSNTWFLLAKHNLLLMLMFLGTYSVALFVVFYLSENSGKTEEQLWNISASKLSGAVMLLGLLSLAGMPPFAGFYLKILVILSAMQGHALVISVGVLVASISMTYLYIRLFYTLVSGTQYSSLLMMDSLLVSGVLIGLVSAPIAILMVLRSSVSMLSFELSESN